ncbi:MAG: hypothetical protein KAI47_17570 [Deltaproteobacteria bacterium]|nr:hypothetical protein [Deltaproteobacteria bacterium]
MTVGVDRYRDIGEMPRMPRLSGEALLEAMREMWARAHLRGGPEIPRGVTRFRSLDEAQEARRVALRRHVRRLRGDMSDTSS